LKFFKTTNGLGLQDFTLHVEFMISYMPETQTIYQRPNSGVYLQPLAWHRAQARHRAAFADLGPGGASAAQRGYSEPPRMAAPG